MSKLIENVGKKFNNTEGYLVVAVVLLVIAGMSIAWNKKQTANNEAMWEVIKSNSTKYNLMGVDVYATGKNHNATFTNEDDVHGIFINKSGAICGILVTERAVAGNDISPIKSFDEEFRTMFAEFGVPVTTAETIEFKNGGIVRYEGSKNGKKLVHLAQTYNLKDYYVCYVYLVTDAEPYKEWLESEMALNNTVMNLQYSGRFE